MLRLIPKHSSSASISSSSISTATQPVQQQRLGIFSGASSAMISNMNILNPDGSMAWNALPEPLTLKIVVNMQQPGAPRDFVHDLKDLWAEKKENGPTLY